jgi:D-arginine dehydrogenase
MEKLPEQTRFVIVGAGFAGAATAWSLGRAGLGPGIILERESVYGFHASGRNAALLYLVESDPVVLALALRSFGHLRALESAGGPLIHMTGGLTTAGTANADEFAEHQHLFRHYGLETTLLSRDPARSRFPILNALAFDLALWCPSEGVVDNHALLTLYLQLARATGFRLYQNCTVEDLVVNAGRIAGVHTNRGDVSADVVIDASGAWAGRLGRGAQPLPLQPKRRHLFVTGAAAGIVSGVPFVWDEESSFYFRPESDGVLFSPCDETPMAPCDPPIDPAAAELLGEKLARKAPSFVDLPLRRSWACLRTFAPDHRPFIGPDPQLPGLFHVSGLGGFGMGASAGVGELAATLLAGARPDWVDANTVRPGR